MKSSPSIPPSAWLAALLATGLASASLPARAAPPCDQAASAPDLAITSPAKPAATEGPDIGGLAKPHLPAGSMDLKQLQSEMQEATPSPLTGDFSHDFTQEMLQQLERTVRTATIAACRGETPELRDLAQKIVNVELELKAELRRWRERDLRKR